ncbi:hypothetical protein V8C26DRAFT_394096 [Trichoderma gracile]
MDLSINLALATPLQSMDIRPLSPGSSSAYKEAILVVCCLGGGISIVTVLVVAVMISKQRARRRKIEEKDAEIEATDAWAKGV